MPPRLKLRVIKPGGEPELIRSGQTRAVHGKATDKPVELGTNLWDEVLDEAESGEAPESLVTCAPADRAFPGLHRWMSDPVESLPAWVAVRWAEPVTIREVSLVFDTGLHRLLTQSGADTYTAKMQWGQAQAETVRDYLIEAETSEGWIEVKSEQDNFQRLRRHQLEVPVEATALRVTVTATNGLDHARVMEMRAYG